jgi:hypothetical protein
MEFLIKYYYLIFPKNFNLILGSSQATDNYGMSFHYAPAGSRSLVLVLSLMACALAETESPLFGLLSGLTFVNNGVVRQSDKFVLAHPFPSPPSDLIYLEVAHAHCYVTCHLHIASVWYCLASPKILQTQSLCAV